MFCTLVQKKGKIYHQQSKLILFITMCQKNVLLFFKNKKYILYSLVEQKKLIEGNLIDQPLKAINISDLKVLIILKNSKELSILDLKNNKLEFILKIPSLKNLSENKLAEVFFLTQLVKFNNTGTFFLRQEKIEDKKSKIFRISYFLNYKERSHQKITIQSFLKYQINTNYQYIQKIDEYSRIVAMKQNIQAPGLYKFKIIHLQNQLKDIQYSIQNQVFTPFATIMKIVAIKDNKLMMFINSPKKNILIISNKEAQLFPYSSDNIFLDCILLNIKENYGFFLYQSNKNYYYRGDIMNIQTGEIIERIEFNINDIVTGQQSDYFISYKKEVRQKSYLDYSIYQIIIKRTLYMKMIKSIQTLKQCPDNFMKQIINLL